MRNYFTLFFFLIFCSGFFAEAQSQKQFSDVSSGYTIAEDKNNQPVFPSSIDTLKPSSFSQSCFVNYFSSLVIYTADYVSPFYSGFVSGNNIYGDLEKAQHYINTSSLSIVGCAVLLNRTKSSNTSTVGARVKLYSYVSNKPSAVLATSALIQQDSLKNNGFTVFIFPSAVSLSGDFVVSVVLPANPGDTMAVYSTKTNCNSGQSLSWERAADTLWGTIHTNWNFSSGKDIDLAIFPIYSSTTSIINPEENPSLIYFDNGENILHLISHGNKTQVKIFDVCGRIVFSKNDFTEDNLDLSFLNRGCYLVKLGNDKNAAVKKIVISCK